MSTASSSGIKGGNRSRTYNLVLIEPSSSARVRSVILEHTEVNGEQVDLWMQEPPSVILERRSLNEVVELRSRLMRLGVTARIEEASNVVEPPESQLETEQPQISDTKEEEIKEEKILADLTAIANKTLQYQSKVPSSSIGSGLFSGSRLWTCLISLVVMILVLSVLGIWMLGRLKDNLDKTKPANITSSVVDGKQQLSMIQHRPTPSQQQKEMMADAKNALQNKDGAKATEVLAQYRQIQTAQVIAKALKTSNDFQSNFDIESPALSMISDLEELSVINSFSLGSTVDWEITGTRISGKTNLPESTAVTVTVRIPSRSSNDFRTMVVNAKIGIPLFQDIPVGTVIIIVQMMPVSDQPISVQTVLTHIPEFQTSQVMIRNQLDVEKERQLSKIPTEKVSLKQIANRIKIQGFKANAVQSKLNSFPRSTIIIQGESQDPYLFLKSAVLAAGQITSTINDPAEWIIIKVNGKYYWIDSFRCREAIRKFQIHDSALDDFIVSHLIMI
jgi:hypothetical protein